MILDHQSQAFGQQRRWARPEERKLASKRLLAPENLEVVVKKMHFGEVLCPKCQFGFKVK